LPPNEIKYHLYIKSISNDAENENVYLNRDNKITAEPVLRRADYSYIVFKTENYNRAKANWIMQRKPILVKLLCDSEGLHSKTFSARSARETIDGDFRGRTVERGSYSSDHLGDLVMSMPQCGSPMGLKNGEEAQTKLIQFIDEHFGQRVIYPVCPESSYQVDKQHYDWLWSPSVEGSPWIRRFVEHCVALVHNYNFNAVYKAIRQDGSTDSILADMDYKARMRNIIYQMIDNAMDDGVVTTVLQSFEAMDYELPKFKGI